EISQKTGSDGRFEFPALASGRYLLSAAKSPEGNLGVPCEAYQEVILTRGDQPEVELVLPPGIKITGRFVEEGTGTGIAEVVLINDDPKIDRRELGAKVVTDSEGAFAADYCTTVPADRE